MENKLIPGILIGAIVGGAATLADKSTRNALVQSVKMLKKVIVHANLLNSILLKTKFYIGKIQLKKFVVIPELEKSIKDAKDTFVERKNNRIGQ